MIPVMIDSGAWSAYTQKEEISLSAYIDYIKELLEKGWDFEFLNLDVVGDAKTSYRNWKRMRREGLEPWPVFHGLVTVGERKGADTEQQWLRRYLESSDKLALGGIAFVPTTRRQMFLDTLWENFLIDDDRMPKVRVHGLGLTSFTLMRRYPWYSVDSGSWMRLGVYGKVCLPRWKGGEWDYTQPYVLGFSHKSPTRGEKGKHFDNLGPKEQEIVMRYLTSIGVSLGTSRTVDGEEEVVEPGVGNHYLTRCEVNALYFARSTHGLVWPRPFKARVPKGLL